MPARPTHDLSHIAIPSVLSAEQCAGLISPSAKRWERGVTIGGVSDMRTSDVYWTRRPTIHRAVCAAAERAAKLLGLDVDTGALGALQVSRYAPGQFYDWHQDSGCEETRYRLLTLVLALDDNGILELPVVGVVPVRQGAALCFRSTIWHRAPASRRQRHSLVAWIPKKDLLK